MGDAIDIRYEAADIIAQINDDLAVLVMVTDKGRIAVHMKRTVLLGLYVQVKQALEQ